MKSIHRKAVIFGSVIGSLHFLLCVFLFILVQRSDDGQALVAWFFMFEVDYPSAEFLYETLGHAPIMESLIEWWWQTAGKQGPNIRALLIFGIFGSVQCFFVSTLVGELFLQLHRIFRAKAVSANG